MFIKIMFKKRYALKEDNPEKRHYRDVFYLKVDALDSGRFWGKGFDNKLLYFDIAC